MAVLAALVTSAQAQTTGVDRAASEQLTQYLRAHELPLVGASVSRAADGSEQVMLYGYVATNQGKQAAARRATKYFHNEPAITLINRIAVNPEIRDLGSRQRTATNNSEPPGGYAVAPGLAPPSGPLTWDQVYHEIQLNGIHPAPDAGDMSSPSPW
ncbi:MAG: hypothetical protein IVW54_06410 [Candidatus Binataceae bacterium]|nr:hypothetical protein [Candidatus Binataceae bacterium]